MNLHANAALSVNGGRQLCCCVVGEERTLTEAAFAAGASVRCARKWVGRYGQVGDAGPLDRSSTPRRIPPQTSRERARRPDPHRRQEARKGSQLGAPPAQQQTGERAPAGRRRAAAAVDRLQVGPE